MAPTAITVTDTIPPTTLKQSTILVSDVQPTHILHRTPWRPSLAVSAQGSHITLDDGRDLIDGVGGAAVSCIGMGHPDVVQAVQEQVEKMAC